MYYRARDRLLGSEIMFKIGFDNDQYIKTQSGHIEKRIAQFGGKLYLEVRNG